MVWHWLTLFGTCVYHHETICRAHSWSRYDINISHQGQIYSFFFMTWVCVWATVFLSRDIVILSLTHECITMVHMWCTFMTSVWPWPQYQNYIFTMNLSLARLSLFFKIGIENVGIKVCVPSWPLYDLDLWPICGWRGYPQWVLL